MPLTEDEAERAIRETFPDLGLWDQRLKTTFTPNALSELARDDNDWPPRPLSQVAWSALAASNDHLKAIRDATLHRIVYPWATLSMSRGALIGAAVAAWVLLPDDSSERRRRARDVVADDLENLRKFINDVERAAGPAGTAAALVAKRLAGLGPRKRLNTTGIVEEVAGVVFGPEYATEAVVEWRRGSGAVHRHMWPHAIQYAGDPAVGAKESIGPLSRLEVRGSLGSVVNGYMLAYRLQRRAWELLDSRNIRIGLR